MSYRNRVLHSWDIGLQAGGLTCGWIGVAEQQACTGALQYGGFRWSNCAR